MTSSLEARSQNPAHSDSHSVHGFETDFVVPVQFYGLIAAARFSTARHGWYLPCSRTQSAPTCDCAIPAGAGTVSNLRKSRDGSKQEQGPFLFPSSTSARCSNSNLSPFGADWAWWKLTRCL